MNFGGLLKAFDAVMAFRDAAKRFKGEGPAETAISPASSAAAQGLAGQIEARLTNVVVAALKEAFDRDHARLELERAQLEEERRRAQEALRHELRRQSMDRELARLRLISGGALIGWIASLALVATGAEALAVAVRVALAVGWVLLLASLGAAFTAQGRIGTAPAEPDGAIQPIPAAAASLWLLIAGLAVTAGSLLL
jgi:hypothetical protein